MLLQGPGSLGAKYDRWYLDKHETGRGRKRDRAIRYTMIQDLRIKQRAEVRTLRTVDEGGGNPQIGNSADCVMMHQVTWARPAGKDDSMRVVS